MGVWLGHRHLARRCHKVRAPSSLTLIVTVFVRAAQASTRTSLGHFRCFMPPPSSDHPSSTLGRAVEAREMYHALMRAYVKIGKDVEGLLSKIRADELDEHEVTKKILKARKNKS